MVERITEGQGVIEVNTQKIVSKKMPVFYNPDMKLSRDFTVLLLSCMDDHHHCGLPLAGSGIRAVRLFKECTNVKTVCANDINQKAFENMQKNLKLNLIDFSREKYPSKNPRKRIVGVFNKDAEVFLLDSKGFSYIEIDPFGDPNPFLDASLKRIARKGILGVTATDTSALCGTYPKACMRKYNAKPLLNELCFETGLRILVRKVQVVASQYEKIAVPIYSYYQGHYMRVFFIMHYSKTKCDEVLAQHKYLLYCSKCLERRYSATNHGECCGNEMDYAGPLYSGDIWDPKLTAKMMKANKNLDNHEFLKTIQGESETDSVGYYCIHSFNKKYKIAQLRKNMDVLDDIKKAGYKACLSHFNDYSIRTDMSVKEFVEILRKKKL